MQSLNTFKRKSKVRNIYKMSPGKHNGKNYGGEHTGTGKYQNGGPYSSNGQRFKKIPNYMFEEDRLVKYIGTHKDFVRKGGVVVSKAGDKHKSGRSFIKVQLETGPTVYFHKNNLRFV